MIKLVVAVVMSCAAMCLADARQEAYEVLKPYGGTAAAETGVDVSKLPTVMAGYQGWFRCEGDGAGVGWHHYGGKGKFEPGACGIELWPDVSEFGADEKFATPFRHADGSTAHVFSSVNPKTVRRHFEWMKQYGIDGVFVQRFASVTRDPRFLKPANRVLASCRDAAHETGRAWVAMYDLSGIKPGQISGIIEDWKELSARLSPGTDARYVKVKGKPLVAVWGLGFSDREPMLGEWRELLTFLKGQGCSIMLGVPTYWRTLKQDAISDAELHKVIAEFGDVLSPWSVGRYGRPESAAKTADNVWREDVAWCNGRGIQFLPVCFPGFSWHNLQASRGKEAKLNQIPRLGGEFFWSQAIGAKRAGATAIYVAMFDEMDEGTAIFKISNDPPTGASPFVTYEGLPSDHYLWLAGQAGRFMRGELKTDEAPVRGRRPPEMQK
jgi:hypothetical protein